jgi:hypothetical protein
MLKITDPGYFLPQIRALSWGDVFMNGANTPQTIRGVCKKTGNKGDYVVKYRGAERMYPGACAKELIAACMANQMEFNVAEPAIIEISLEFVNSLIGNRLYKIASKSVGLNYGSTYIPNSSSFLNGNDYPDDSWLYLADIFAFDLLIANVDRNNVKRNLFYDGEKFILFDHELAYGFIHEIPANQQPWLIKEIHTKSISAHLFFKHLQGKNVTFVNFASKMSLLDTAFWNKLEEIIPDEWMTEEYSKIKFGILATIEHKDEFINELKKILQ